MLRVMAMFLLSGPGEEEEDEEETAEEKSSVSIEEWVEVNTLVFSTSNLLSLLSISVLIVIPF